MRRRPRQLALALLTGIGALASIFSPIVAGRACAQAGLPAADDPVRVGATQGTIPTVPASGDPGTGQHYRIEVALDPLRHVVSGTTRIHYRSDASAVTNEAFLHLYANAFADDGTVFMRESAGRLRGIARSGRGSIDIHSIVVDMADEDGAHLNAELLPAADDELIPGDHTQMRLALPAPLAPGATMDLTVRFTTALPPVFARSGYADSFHMVAQFFPKLARREPDGRWATFPYHGFGEFYADFATYELQVTAPPDFVIGATGTAAGREPRGNQVVHHFVARRVHDVAFAAWPHFREYRRTEQGVRIRILYPAGFQSVLPTYAAVVTDGLRRFGRLFGAYPYPELTVIVPPRGAEGAAGMEYPTLFASAGGWLPIPFAPIGAAEGTTAHELAHQWFQGMIATDEVTWPMLDEGLTQWATGDLLTARHGETRAGLAIAGLELSFFELMRIAALRAPLPGPPGRSADEFHSADDYGRSVYARTCVVIETLGRTHGKRRIERALGRYARSQRFAHPDPADLYGAFDAELGTGFSARLLAPALMEGRVADLLVESVATAPEAGGHRNRVQLRRRPGRNQTPALALDSSVALTYSDGTQRRIPWPAAEGDLVIDEVAATPLWAAEVDPDRQNLLDPSRLDNARLADGARRPHRSLTAWALYLAQVGLELLGP